MPRLINPAARATARFGLVLVLVSLLAAWSFRIHGQPKVGIDDANIFFVYASNLADGHGFVYNVGGERVEGFTSLLWVLVLTPFFALSRSPERDILFLCIVLAAATHTVITLYIDGLYSKGSRSKFWSISLASALYLLLILASPAYITWMTVALMDVCLWGFLLATTTVFLMTDADRSSRRSSFLFSLLILLLILTRPEAIVLCPVFIGLRWLSQVASGSAIKKASMDALPPTVAYVCSLVGLTAFRLSYFGYPLPNTFYAKVSPSLAYNLATGSDYLQSYVRSSPVVSLSILVLLVALAWRFVKLTTGWLKTSTYKTVLADVVTPSTLCALVSAVLLCLPVISAGDHFVWWRFYQSAYPLLLLSMFALAYDLIAGLEFSGFPWNNASLAQRTVVLMVCAAFMLAFLQNDSNWWSLRFHQPIGNEFRIASMGKTTGEVLARNFSGQPTWPTIGVYVAGGIKRTYPGEIVDLMGLNSVAMAHSAGDRRGMKNHAAFSKDVFYQLLPDLVWLRQESRDWSLEAYANPNLTNTPVNYVAAHVLRNLPNEASFLELYDYAYVRHKDSRYWIDAFYRTDFLGRLANSGQYEIRLAEGTPSFGKDAEPR